MAGATELCASPTAFSGQWAWPGTDRFFVAAGEIEASVHLWGGPWDHAPFAVLVEEAGGRFTDLWGGRRIDTGTAIFSNGIVHESVRSAVAVGAPAHSEVPGDAP